MSPAPVHPDDIGKSPPHDLEAEICVLGALLLDNDIHTDVAPILAAEDFYRKGHGIIYRAIVEDLEDGRGVDAVLLREKLQRDGHLEDIGGPEALVNLLDKVPTAAHALHYAEIVKELSVKRGIILAAAQFMSEGANGKRSADVLADHHVRIEDLERDSAGTALATFSATDIPAMEIAPLKPLVGPNLVSEGGFLAVVGKQGLGKTFAVFDLALLLSNGKGGKWLGVEVVSEAIPVLWLFGEGGKARVKDRIGQLTHGADLPDRLHFYVPEDYALDLCNPRDVAKVRITIEQMKARYSSPTVFLVIDPLADWAVYDQNTEADRLLRGLRSLQRKLNATVCVVHHPKKPQVGAAKGDSNNARGDSRLAGAVQSMLMFDQEDEDKVRLTWAKHNDAPHMEPLIARLDGGTVEEPGSFRFRILRALGDVKPAVDQIRDALLDAYNMNSRGMTKTQIMTSTGLSKASVNRYLPRLVKLGQVEVDGVEGSALSLYRLVQEGD